MLNRLSSGRNCLRLGQRAVRKATTHYKLTLRRFTHTKVLLTRTLKTKIKTVSQTFSSLRPGRCGFLFNSRSYVNTKRTYRRYVNHKRVIQGRLSEAKRTLHRAIWYARRQVKKCQCAAKLARNRLWMTLTKTSTRTRQVKAYKKCKMMSCVLKGINIRNRQCSTPLKKNKNRRLDARTERVRGCRAPPRKMIRARKQRRLGRL